MRILSLPLAAALALAFAPSASAQVRSFEVQRASRVEFVSDAPLETITGRSSQVRGEIRLDPSDLSTASGTIRVPVASLRTGNDLRDEHLRDDGWLDAERFPDATFEITRFEGASELQPNRPTRLRLRGRFTVHGVTRDVVANVNVRHTGDELRGTATFNLELTDYDVSVPLPVRLKVSNEIRVNVTLRASASSG